jgi:bacillithiol system protein YtxJ
MVPTPHLLTNLHELERAMASSNRPILLFKHSPTCGTSAEAEEEILQLLAGPRKLGVDVYQIDVRTSRGLSEAIATRFKIRHESPQALIIADGALVWSASHFRVTADAILAAVDRLATTSA